MRDVIQRDDDGIPATEWEFFKALATGELTGADFQGATQTTTIRLPIFVHARMKALAEISGLPYNTCVIQALHGALYRLEVDLEANQVDDLEERAMRKVQEMVGDVEPVRKLNPKKEASA